MNRKGYPDEIQSIAAIQKLVMLGFNDWEQYGDVKVTARGDLLLFGYTTAAHIANRWNTFECVSRGLIINQKTGEIVARPFDKFFYWLTGRKAKGHIVTVTEKVDGSLGILYRHKGEYHVTTKGSFFSPQGRWATRFLSENHDLTDLPDELTLLFEIIYPDNRIIIDYAERQELVLLAARNRHTGEYLPFFPDVYNLGQQYGFPLPQVHSYNTIDDIIAQTGQLNTNTEGWVVEFSDGQRFKFKMDEYIEIHQLLRGLDFPNILQQVADGHINTILQTVPDAFLGDAKRWIEEIRVTVADIQDQAQAVFSVAPKESREAFVLWVDENHAPLKPYLLAMFDQADAPQAIYKHAFQERWAQLDNIP
jgi:RNA ligase